jgi:hypothetical protein
MSISAAVFGYARNSSFYTLSGGSWNTAYPITNLFQMGLSRIGRTTNATTGSTIIKGTASATHSVGVVMLSGTNLQVSATVRIRFYSDAAWTTQIYDSGAIAWPGGVWWGAGTNYAVRSFQIDIADTSNPDGYIEIGWLELANSVQPTYSFQFGADLGFRARTQKTEVLGGSIYFDRRDKPRVFSGTFTSPDAESINIFLAMQEVYDIDTPFIWLPHPTDNSKWIATAFLARFVDLNAMRYVKYGVKEVPINLEEVL